MIKQTITILLMLSISLQDCGDGCLRCVKPSSDNAVPECVYCDTYSHYYLREGTCLKSQDLECELLTQNGECLRCSKTHYIDLATLKCLQVDDQNRIDKCYRYNDKQQCQQCNGPFILSNNKCIAINNLIQNCLLYNNDQQCQQCENGYYYDQVIQQCLQLNSSPECISHSRFMCFQCEKGLVLDSNYYFESKFLFQSSLDNEYIFDILRLRQQGQPVIKNDILQCRNSQINNCKTYKNHKECLGCQDNFYLLSDGTCKEYPKQPIPYCLQYQTFNVCQKCTQGAVMTGLGKCRLLEDKEFISNCNTYSQTARVALCTSCSPEFYVYDNKCVQRLHQNVEGCNQYDPIADKCQQCGTGQILGNDGLKCLNVITNCEQHQSFDQQTTQDQLVCLKCNNLYYLDNNECLAGTQSNCELYQTSANICVQCQERFYGAPDCKEHGDIQYCDNYSKTQLNICDKCDNNHRTFRWLEKCEDLPKIDNCLLYEDNTNNQTNLCSQCVSKFTLTSNKTCESIDVNQCIEANWVDNGTDICTKCDLNVGLATSNNNSDKSCQTPFYYLTDLCDQMNQAQENFLDFQCDVCKVHSIPFNFGAHSICIEDSKLEYLSSAVTLVDNCDVYEDNTKCQKCAKGWYLSDDRLSCKKNQCDDGSGGQYPFNAFEMTSDNNNVINQTFQNKCLTTKTDENLILAPAVNDFSEQIVVGCSDNFISVYKDTNTADIKYSNVNPSNRESQNWVDHIMDVYPSLYCPSKPTPGGNTTYTINGETNTNPIPECAGYGGTTNQYHCLKCPFGKTGNISSDTLDTLIKRGRIESCETMTNCSANRFKNIHPYYEQLFSCHECTEQGKIPVIAYPGSSNNNPTLKQTVNVFQQFSFSNNEDWTDVTPANTELSKHIFCMDVSTEDSIRQKLNIEYTDDNYGKVIPLPNCGLAVLNLSDNNNFDNSNSLANAGPQNGQSLFCGVCKPGYKPTYQSIIAVKCERIDNCLDNGEWFNACSGCYPGFRYEYKDNKINYDSCVRIPFNTPGLDHCYSYQRLNPQDESDLSGACVVCKKGYVLNEDNYCDKIVVPSCSENQFIKPNEYRDHEENLRFVLYVNQGTNGCSKCNQGYHSLSSSLLNITSYCIGSEYLQTNQLEFPVQSSLDQNDDYNNSNYIDKCVKYKANYSPECSECIEGYILRNDGKACINNLLFPNCILLDSTSFNCVKCQTGFGLVTGVYTGCIKNEIQNCKTINENIAHDKVTCITCNEGYYLEDNQCKQGYIPNCSIYESKDICTQCQDGYWSFGMESGSQTYITDKTYYCIEKAGQTNCKVANFANSLGDLKCKTCDEPYQKIVNNQHGANIQDNKEIDLSLCLTIGDIENCEQYDKDLYLDKRIFKCIKCNVQNYLNTDGSQCLERKVFFDSCKTYDTNQDLCIECQDNYILNVNKKQCDMYPQGISNCLIYITDDNNKFQCNKCQNQTYLQDNQCIDIIKDQQIKNCQYYKGPSECSECITGYFLEDNVCVKLDLIDCQIPLSSQECQVCNTGFRLFSDNGLNKCISLDKKNCLQFEQNSYNKCLLCKTHYYPDENGDCQVVDDIIQNCIVYSGKKQCQQCQPEYALKWDQTECISKENYDTKCTQTVHTSIPICNVCQAGYHLKNGRCIQFKESIQQGCFYYNKISNNCQFCKILYHMNKDGICTLNSDQVIDEQTGDNGSDNNEDDNENYIFKLQTLFTILILVILN